MNLDFRNIGTVEGEALLQSITPQVKAYTDENHCTVIKRNGAHVHFPEFHNAIMVAKHNDSLFFREFWNDNLLIVATDGKPGFIECSFNGCKATDCMFLPPELIEAEIA